MRLRHILFFVLTTICTTIHTGEVFAQEKGTKFCFTDFDNTGNTFELTLINGGKASITIKDKYDEVIRKGEGTWRGVNDGVGGDAPQIILKLSTGLIKFTVVVDQFSSNISMLIDVKKNQWIKCSS